MRVTIEDVPRTWFTGDKAAGLARIEHMHVPLLCGRVNRMPDRLEALILTSDLQARERDWPRSPTAGRLFGEEVAEGVADWMRDHGLSPIDAGVVLPGDYWSYPMETAKRGGYGDVRPVWDAFADRFNFVVGIPGNHDIFESVISRNPSVKAWRKNIALLERSQLDWGGLRVSGVGGCVGNAERPFRYEELHQRDRLLAAIDEVPDMLILHQGPPGKGRARDGAVQVEDCLDLIENETLVVCGHEHTTQRLHTVGQAQVLNVHEAVVVLLPDQGAPESSSFRIKPGVKSDVL